MKTFDGYSKEKFSDTSVLLAGGGSKELSNFIGTLNWDSTNRKLQYKKIGDTNWSDLVTFGSNATNSTAYLPLAGGTMTGLLTTTSGNNHKGIKVGNTYINAINGDLIFQNNSAIRFGGDSWDYNVWAGLKYVHSSKTIYLGLADGSAFTANSAQSGGKLYLPGIANIYTGNGTNLVWHAGNDGTGSGLDADLLDGIDSTGFLKNYSQNYGSTISSAVDISPTLTTGIARVHISNVEYSSVLTGYDYNNKAWQLRFRPSSNDGIYFRSQGTGTAWNVVAFTTDNVASATKLQTSRTLWGRPFDGTSNVNGNITMNGEYSLNAYMPRKRADGGGWAYSPFKIRDADNNTFVNMGVMGGNSILSYIFIGCNTFDSSENLRIYPNGKVFATGFKKDGSDDSYVLLGGGGHKLISDFATASHNHDGRYLKYEGLWTSGSDQNIDDSLGINFTYTSHGAPHHWGTTVTFEYERGSSYRLQLHGTGDNYLFFRNRSSDYGGWHSSGWKQILTNQDTYVASDGTNRGIINGVEVASARHLLINNSTWNSNWYWSGQSGQPTWLWGSNDGTNCYVWNPSNFSVNYANSAGYLTGANPQIAATSESNEVYIYDYGNGTADSVMNTNVGLRKAIRFRWYDNYWSMGIIRGGGSNTLGMGWSYNTSATVSSLKMCLDNNGNLTVASNFYTSSDIRLKSIINYLDISYKDLAILPLFNFIWKNKEDSEILSGTSAQAVQKILPNIVHGNETLTLSYATLGTIAGITACKELVNQKSEIDLLKERIEQLEQKLKMINDYGRC